MENRENEEKKFEIKGLDLYYGKFQALEKVDMDVYANKITAFIGPSGCGKSTFLRTLNRMNDLIPSVRIEGEVLIDDLNIYDKKVDVVNLRKMIGMVFQKSNPFAKSIFENIAYGPKINGINNKKILEEIVVTSLQ